MMVLGKLIKEIVMFENVFTLSILAAIIALIGAVLFFNVAQLKAVEKNVQTAIEKGIDPVAVRCAYANERDHVCVAYAASQHGFQTPTKGK
jgi:hypothetical protein